MSFYPEFVFSSDYTDMCQSVSPYFCWSDKRTCLPKVSNLPNKHLVFHTLLRDRSITGTDTRKLELDVQDSS